MDNKTFISRVSATSGLSTEQALQLTETLSEAIRRNCGALDSIALPGFGTFVPEKHDERIVIDESTGRRMMLPPEIILTFSAGSMLKKNVDNE